MYKNVMKELKKPGDDTDSVDEYNYRDGELANENKLKDSVDYTAYKEIIPDVLPKFKFRKRMIDEFREILMSEITPLID